MVMIDNYQQVARKVKQLEDERLRAEGGYASAMKTIKDEMGVKTLEEAEAVVEEDLLAEQAAAVTYTAEFDKFKKDFPQVLDE